MASRTGAFLLTLTMVVAGGRSWAAAPPTPIPIAVRSGNQTFPHLVSDGGRGVFVSWHHADGHPPVLQMVRLDESGTLAPGWPAGGRTVVEGGLLNIAELIADGDGGVFITPTRDVLSEMRTFVHHVLGSGPDPSWPDTAVAVTDLSIPQVYPSAAPDGVGGVFIAWNQADADNPHIRLQHLESDAGRGSGWDASGKVLGPANYRPLTCPDGAGGVFVLRVDRFNDLFLHRWGRDGQPSQGWFAAGTWLTLVSYTGVALESDGDGGAFVVGAARGSLQIHAIHVLGDGRVDPAWPSEGVPIREGVTWLHQNYEVARDGNGGLFVSWIEWAGPDADPEIRLQHVLGSGLPDPRWPPSGRLVSIGGTGEWSPKLETDARGTAYVAWEVFHTGGGELDSVFVQRIRQDAHAAAGWPESGRLVAGPGAQDASLAVNAAGAWLVWENGLVDGGDIYAALIPDTPEGGPIAPWLTIRSIAPNPFSREARVYVETTERGRLEVRVLDVTGRLVRVLRDEGDVPAGAVVVPWDGRDQDGRVAPSGMYVVETRAAGKNVDRRRLVKVE